MTVRISVRGLLTAISIRIPGNGHGGPGFATPESRKRIGDFFDKHLK